ALPLRQQHIGARPSGVWAMQAAHGGREDRSPRRVRWRHYAYRGGLFPQGVTRPCNLNPAPDGAMRPGLAVEAPNHCGLVATLLKRLGGESFCERSTT